MEMQVVKDSAPVIPRAEEMFPRTFELDWRETIDGIIGQLQLIAKLPISEAYICGMMDVRDALNEEIGMSMHDLLHS